MKPKELQQCAKRLGVTPAVLLRLVGSKGSITEMQAVCIRAMVLHPAVKDVVDKIRIRFPGAELTAVRRLEDGKH